jgi:DNA polymerase-3 subunit alpha
MKFINLHTHSHYSLLAGLSKIEDLIAKAKDSGMTALALTDNHNLYGAVPFYQRAVKAGIKPIIGIHAYLAETSRHEKNPSPTNRTFGLTLLAETNEGYKNLIKLVTIGNLEGYYQGPRIDKEILRKYSKGLIALSGDMHSELFRALWGEDKKHAEKIIAEYQEIFGKENFFVEVMHHPKIERHEEVTKELVALAKKVGASIVATHDSYYTTPADKEAHRTLLAVQHTHTSDDLRYLGNEEDFSFMLPKDAEKIFKHIPEALENSVKIAERCNVEIKSDGWIFPNIPVADDCKTHEEQLKKYAYAGIPQRGLTETKEVVERLEYELDIINQKGYAPYFLVVADLLYFARKHNILTTIRGSVAGSLVTYLTKITNVDPLEYKLPFERFLNPERPSAPDIDMDYADDRRDEMIAYAKEKYGEDKVAQIGTFGTMLARGVVRDVARALGYPYGLGDRIAKMIPFGSQGFPMTIKKAMELTPELAQAYEKDVEVKTVIDLAKKLEGNARHVSVHAAGVVITPVPLSELVPLQREPNGDKIITQYDMHVVEDLGLLKFDFLGIRNLSILSKAVDLVKKIQGITVDIENVPRDDKKTFEMLARGETMGLFQLNGSGMTRALKELRPTTIHDINVMVALYRPGPMDNIYEYIARKHGTKPAKYAHPKMKTFLDTTFGVLVYQDDLLMTAIKVAGYSWGEVDKFRKAVGKKIPEEMKKQHIIFVEGCQKHSGMTEKEAEALWDLFEPFQGYGFNKAHAASYGLVAYQTAYMKANFPSEYMTAVLTAESGDVEEIARIVAETKRMGIPVLPPDVNESLGDFAVVKNSAGTEGSGDSIRFGLHTIKNLGEEIANAIIAERKENGPYLDFSDFLHRVKHQNLNKRSLEALIKSGSFDSLGERGDFMANLEEALAFNRENMKASQNQDSLFMLIADESIPKLRLKKGEPLDQMQKLAWEKELLGLYISGHPLERFGDRFKGKRTLKDYKAMPSGAMVVVGGIIEDIRTVVTKRGERMAFVKLADFDDSIEVVFFPRTYEELREQIIPDTCIAIEGRLSNRNDETSIVADKMKVL